LICSLCVIEIANDHWSAAKIDDAKTLAQSKEGRGLNFDANSLSKALVATRYVDHTIGFQLQTRPPQWRFPSTSEGVGD
jgi:hypothetical protein|tara:strand:- start:170 stop:406 length:237 start_codon:yes stop_codon:yes gene_type:complete